MKKIYIFILSLSFFINAVAQQIDATTTKALITKNAKVAGFTENDILNYTISSSYKEGDITYVYLLQTLDGIQVRNQMKILTFRNEKLLSSSGSFIQNSKSLSSNKSAKPTVAPIDAVEAAFNEERISEKPSRSKLKITNAEKNEFTLNKSDEVSENVLGKLIWLPTLDDKGDTKKLDLVWEVTVAPIGSDDIWQIFVDANSGNVVGKQNLTVYEKSAHSDNKLSSEVPILLKKNVEKSESYQKSNSPSAVANASYLVIPYPFEAPSFGAPAVRNNPWEAAPVASPLGWHSDGTTDYNITRGNNVWATEEAGTPSGENTGIPATSTTSPNLTFQFAPDFSQIDPRQSAFQQFAITNVFYWSNIIHDLTYLYGFNENAANFQTNNLGRGRLGGDNVRALAQSAQGGAIGNNANFSTPPDGSRPRMRMYIFENPVTTKIRVNSPSTVAGSYNTTQSLFSINNNLLGNLTAQAIYFNDTTGTHLACTGGPINSLLGKIALIDRGSCNFTVKVKEAQNAGAAAVIVINNAPGLFAMGPSAATQQAGFDNSITIPAFSISQADGNALAAQIANNLNITLMGGGLDGDLDNGIIVHEYGHGVSNRLTGGGGNTTCLQNAEQGGEGWSDYLGLMLTTDWANTPLTDGTRPRGIGTYASGQTPTGSGIRPAPYSTNLATNSLTYANMGTNPYNNGIAGTSPHAIGTMWCTALWDMTWGIIQQEGAINPNLYNFSLSNNGGNSIALKLVLEGMRLQPCSPGFIDARNAILAADRNLYAGKHACAIWTAFAKRGMGFGASQGSSGSTSDQLASNALPSAPVIATQPVDVTVDPGATAVFSANAGTDVNLIYNWQVSTNNGTSYTDLPEISSTLSVGNVTLAMNGYKYRARIFVGCDVSTTNAVTLTVNGASAPSFTAQPANVSACVGSNATFTATANGGNNVTFVWEVSTDAGANFTAVTPAANTNTLTLSSVTNAMNNNRYRLKATNAIGTTISSPATLTVTPPAPPALTSQPAAVTICSGAVATFTVASSASGVTYVWQESTNGGTTFTNISPTVTTPTLTLSNVSASLNNNQYRAVVSSSCGNSTSQAATLRVNPSPVVTLSTNPTVGFNPTTGSLNVSATPANSAYTYQWKLNGNVLPTVTGTTLNKDNGLLNGTGIYTVTVTDPATGCSGTSNPITVSAPATSNGIALSPNPSTGPVTVAFNNSTVAPQNMVLNIFDEKGYRVITKQFTTTGLIGNVMVDMTKYRPGIYIFMLMDASGNKISTKKLIKF